MADNSQKLSQLPQLANVALTDRVLVLRDPAGSPSTRTVTTANLFLAIPAANNSYAGVVKVGNNLSINSTGYLSSTGGTANTGDITFNHNIISTSNSSDNLYLYHPNNGIQIGATWLAQMSATSDAGNNIWGSGNTQGYMWVYQDTNHYAEFGTYISNNNFYTEIYNTTNPDRFFTIEAHDPSASPAINVVWSWNTDGVINLPNDGDIQRNGKSVLPPVLTPNIAYTGTFIGYPDVLPVTTGKNIIYTANGSTVSNSNFYWWDDQFYDGNYDLSGATSIALNNIGGLTGQFSFGNKSLNVLASIDLGQVSYISNYFTTNMPSLDYISAGSLAHIQDNLRIYSMDKAETVFDFSNLRYVRNCLQFDWNNVLTTFPSFPELKHIGYIYVNNNDALNNNALEFPALTYLSYIYFYNNGGIVYGPSFPSLTTTGYIYIVNNPVMVYAPNFPALVTCTSTIDIFNHESLINSPVFTNLQTVNGGLQIYNCPAMLHMPNFSNLQHVYGNIFFNNNTSMNGTGTMDFSSLKSVNNFYANNCALTEADVDYILSILVGLDGNNGTTLFTGAVQLDGGSNAPPSAAGLANITILQNRGCSVAVNS
mgnify:CR=1 FL=1